VYQEGPVRLQHSKTESQFRIRRNNFSVTVQEGVTLLDTQHHDTKRVDGACRAISCCLSTDRTSILYTTWEQTAKYSPLIAKADWTVLPPAWVPHRAGALRTHVRAVIWNRPRQRGQAKLPEHITTKLLHNYCTADQINNIICALLSLSLNNPTP